MSILEAYLVNAGSICDSNLYMFLPRHIYSHVGNTGKSHLRWQRVSREQSVEHKYVMHVYAYPCGHK